MTRTAHVVLYSRDAAADRAFLSDVCALRAFDAGGGWLILAAPGGGTGPKHAAHLCVDDLAATHALLTRRGADCSEPAEDGGGATMCVTLPSGAVQRFLQPAVQAPMH